MNEAMATRGSNALVLDTAERSLGEEVSLVEQNASSVIVHNNASYEQAAQITKSLKQMQKKVKDYTRLSRECQRQVSSTGIPLI